MSSFLRLLLSIPKRRWFYLRAISLSLVVCLLVQDFGWAAELKSKDSGSWIVDGGETKTGRGWRVEDRGERQRHLSWAKKLLPAIPESVATIEDAWIKEVGSQESVVGSNNTDYSLPTGNSQLIVLIQDAHTNASSQLNQARLLDILLKNNSALSVKRKALDSNVTAYRLPLTTYIFTEGASGPLNLSEYRNTLPQKDRERIAKKYLQRGLLHATEYLDLTSDKDFTLYGVEDKALYEESLQVYKDITLERKYFSDYLDKIESTIKTLKPKVFNPFLLAFDENIHESDLSEKDRLLLLHEEASFLSVAIPESFKKLKHLESKEKTLDFGLINKEQAELLQSLSAEDRQSLQQASLSKDEKVKDAFYTSIQEKVTNATTYPHLYEYLNYFKEWRALDISTLLNDSQTLQQDIYDSLTQTPSEKALLAARDLLQDYRKLFSVSMTPKEYGEYKNKRGRGKRVEDRGKDVSFPQSFSGNQEGTDPRQNHSGMTVECSSIFSLTGFLNQKLLELDTDHDKALFLEPGFEEALLKAERFYELTYKRDLKFIENMAADPRQKHSGMTILITGGFHTENLKRLLKQKNISFISITPRTLQETNTRRYEEILLSQLKNIPTSQQLLIKHSPKPSLLNTGFLKGEGLMQTPGAIEILKELNGTLAGARLALKMKEIHWDTLPKLIWEKKIISVPSRFVFQYGDDQIFLALVPSERGMLRGIFPEYHDVKQLHYQIHINTNPAGTIHFNVSVVSGVLKILEINIENLKQTKVQVALEDFFSQDHASLEPKVFEKLIDETKISYGFSEFYQSMKTFSKTVADFDKKNNQLDTIVRKYATIFSDLDIGAIWRYGRQRGLALRSKITKMHELGQAYQVVAIKLRDQIGVVQAWLESGGPSDSFTQIIEKSQAARDSFFNFDVSWRNYRSLMEDMIQLAQRYADPEPQKGMAEEKTLNAIAHLREAQYLVWPRGDLEAALAQAEIDRIKNNIFSLGEIGKSTSAEGLTAEMSLVMDQLSEIESSINDISYLFHKDFSESGLSDDRRADVEAVRDIFLSVLERLNTLNYRRYPYLDKDKNKLLKQYLKRSINFVEAAQKIVDPRHSRGGARLALDATQMQEVDLTFMIEDLLKKSEYLDPKSTDRFTQEHKLAIEFVRSRRLSYMTAEEHAKNPIGKMKTMTDVERKYKQALALIPTNPEDSRYLSWAEQEKILAQLKQYFNHQNVPTNHRVRELFIKYGWHPGDDAPKSPMRKRARHGARLANSIQGLAAEAEKDKNNIFVDTSLFPDGGVKRFITLLNEQQIDDVMLGGGAVRDTLLGEEPGDLDFMVRIKLTPEEQKMFDEDLKRLPPQELLSRYGLYRRAIEVLKQVTPNLGVTIDDLRHTRGKFEHAPLEFMMATYIVGSKMINVSDQDTFTIDGLAMDRHGKIYLSSDGRALQDLRDKKILFERRNEWTKDKIKFSPKYAMRAYRFKYQYGFTIEPHDETLIKSRVKAMKPKPNHRKQNLLPSNLTFEASNLGVQPRDFLHPSGKQSLAWVYDMWMRAALDSVPVEHLPALIEDLNQSGILQVLFEQQVDLPLIFSDYGIEMPVISSDDSAEKKITASAPVAKKSKLSREQLIEREVKGWTVSVTDNVDSSKEVFTAFFKYAIKDEGKFIGVSRRTLQDLWKDKEVAWPILISTYDTMRRLAFNQDEAVKGSVYRGALRVYRDAAKSGAEKKKGAETVLQEKEIIDRIESTAALKLLMATDSKGSESQIPRLMPRNDTLAGARLAQESPITFKDIPWAEWNIPKDTIFWPVIEAAIEKRLLAEALESSRTPEGIIVKEEAATKLGITEYKLNSYLKKYSMVEGKPQDLPLLSSLADDLTIENNLHRWRRVVLTEVLRRKHGAVETAAKAMGIDKGTLYSYIELYKLDLNLFRTKKTADISFRTMTQRKEAYERARISEALIATKGEKESAAELLGINKTTLYEKLDKYSIDAHILSTDVQLKTFEGPIQSDDYERPAVIAALFLSYGNKVWASDLLGISTKTLSNRIEKYGLSAEYFRQAPPLRVLGRYKHELLGALNSEERVDFFVHFPEIYQENWSQFESAGKKILDEQKKLEAVEISDILERQALLRSKIELGESLNQVFIEAFAIFSEMSRRINGQTPSLQQVVAAIAMYEGNAVELLPGEGKTLAIAMVSYLYALTGKPTQIHGLNDYLVKRDAEEMGPIFSALGLGVAVIADSVGQYRYEAALASGSSKLAYYESTDRKFSRAGAYKADIIYGVNDEFVFDAMRDRFHPTAVYQQTPSFVVLDEGDGILLDESKTPLIMSQKTGALNLDIYKDTLKIVRKFKDGEHYHYDPVTEEIALDGLVIKNLPDTILARHFSRDEKDRFYSEAIRAEFYLNEGEDYILRDGQIVLIDENTGHVKEGHVFGDYLHEFLIAKHDLKGGTGFRVEQIMSYPVYYRELSRKMPLAMISGTLGHDEAELFEIYGFGSVKVPSSFGQSLIKNGFKVLPTKDEKWAAVVKNVQAMVRAGRPVVIGVASIKEAQELLAALQNTGILASVLDGTQPYQTEKEVIQKAGEVGVVTIGTHVIGRGVNIPLSQETVQNGGLHIIRAVVNSSVRADHQLELRAGRRGDPGTYEVILSKEDKFFTKVNFHGPMSEFTEERVARLQEISENNLRFSRQQSLGPIEILEKYQAWFVEAYHKTADDNPSDLSHLRQAWTAFLTRSYQATFSHHEESFASRMERTFGVFLEHSMPKDSNQLKVTSIDPPQGARLARSVSAEDLSRWIDRIETLAHQNDTAALTPLTEEIKNSLKDDEKSFFEQDWGRDANAASFISPDISNSDRVWIYSFLALAAGTLSSDSPKLEDLRRLDKIIDRWNRKDHPQRWNFSLTFLMQLVTNKAAMGNELKAMMRLSGRGTQLPGEYRYKMAAFTLFLLGMHVRSSNLSSDAFNEISVDFNPKKSLALAANTIESGIFENDVPEALRDELMLGLKVGLTQYIYGSAEAWSQKRTIAPKDLPKIWPLQDFIVDNRKLLLQTMQEVLDKSKESGFIFLSRSIPWMFQYAFIPHDFKESPVATWDRILLNGFDLNNRSFYMQFMAKKNNIESMTLWHAYSDRMEGLMMKVISDVKNFTPTASSAELDAARLALNPPPNRVISDVLLKGKSPSKILSFLARVTLAQGNRVGEIAIGSQRYVTKYSGRSLVITGLRERGDIRLNPKRYRNAMSRAGLLSHVELDLSVSDFKLLYDQSNQIVDTVQFTNIHESREALVEIDLDAIAVDRQWFSAIGLPLLLQEIHRSTRSVWGQSGKYLFAGSDELKAMVSEKISREAKYKNDFSGRVFFDERQISADLLPRKARLTTPQTASLQNGQRYIFMQTPQEGDIPNYRAQLRGAFAWSRVEGELSLTNPSVGELVEYFRRVGVTINRVDGGKDFFLVITGQTPNSEIIQIYAIPPIARYSAAKSIQAARLAVAMTSQSA